MRDLSTIQEPPTITCRLKGRLGKAITTEPMPIKAWSPAGAIAIIRCNYPDFEYELISAEERGIAYRVQCGQIQIEREVDLLNPVGSVDMVIEPVPMGGGGFGKALLGAAMITASFYTGGTFSSLLLSTGISLGATGLAQIIAPQPKTPNTEEERKRSALFDSAGGAAEDGDAVFLHYGQGWISGKVLSQSITVDDL
jgi:predicted phage tail protein